MTTARDNRANPVATSIVLMMTAAILLPSAIQIAYAQSSSAGASTEVQTVYKSSYPKASTSSSSSVSVQSEYHIYKPGDTVKIQGQMSSEAKEQTDADSVMVRIMDAQGTVVANQQATVNGNGEYAASISLPPTAAEGEYNVSSKIEVEASVLGLLDAEVIAKLESPPAQFIVARSNAFEVQSDEGEEFQIEITSNSNVDNVEFKQAEKRVSFVVEGKTGTTGVTEITIPKAMLSGEMMVLIDGEVVTAESNDVIVKSHTDTEITFEINYSHSEHTVEVTGTNVTPEFPVSILVMAGALGSIIAFAAARNRGNWFNILKG
ncbi:MAG: MG2 domain-containing protein [Nitrososphaera sp.]|uniref:Alpha-2-macroglobulin domain-containing protein n=1 Tax=Nitrososphaera gargensis (strain Ga9.2) TaxID=1237085 RepID=K0IDI2_NITGG|nr:MG2 domain-containing protein [Candidatus Nitrososphaera gargensis]AFU57710.1 alpha-2-macroglobulin domain-containing protein [Candidatus Nitrososphaera gargensis Ga9.2]